MKPKSRTPIEDYLIRASSVLYPDKPPHLIDVNARDCDGDTPLHKAASWRDNYAAKLFIEAGAIVDAIGDMGQTPLHVAVGNNYASMVETLLRAGANPDIRSELNFTPRELASRSSDPQMVKLFPK
jgi:ankyrin repeat protein